jgi:hypothetical protein
MMMLRRGDVIVIGLTDDNLRLLVAGGVIEVRGETFSEPALTFLLVNGESNEQMRAELVRNGYNLPQ